MCPACNIVRCSEIPGSIFTDFGDEFVVEDVDGVSPHVGIITAVHERRGSLEVVCLDSESHRLQIGAGDVVKFTEVSLIVFYGLLTFCLYTTLVRFIVLRAKQYAYYSFAHACKKIWYLSCQGISIAFSKVVVIFLLTSSLHFK